MLIGDALRLQRLVVQRAVVRLQVGGVVGGLEVGETDDGCDVPTMFCVGAEVGGAIDGGGLAVVGALVGGDVVGFVVLLLSFVGTLVGSAVVTLLGVG